MLSCSYLVKIERRQISSDKIMGTRIIYWSQLKHSKSFFKGMVVIKWENTLLNNYQKLKIFFNTIPVNCTYFVL